MPKGYQAIKAQKVLDLIVFVVLRTLGLPGQAELRPLVKDFTEISRADRKKEKACPCSMDQVRLIQSMKTYEQ